MSAAIVRPEDDMDYCSCDHIRLAHPDGGPCEQPPHPDYADCTCLGFTHADWDQE